MIPSFSQYLLEALDKPYDFILVDSSDKVRDYRISVPDTTTYEFNISRNEDFLIILFDDLNNTQDMNAVIGTHKNAIRVFSSIAAILRKEHAFINNLPIVIEAKGTSRIKLYDTLTKMMAKELKRTVKTHYTQRYKVWTIE